MDSKQITPKDCIHLANNIIVERNLLIPRLTSMKDINYQLFGLIFNDIFGINCLTFKPNNKSEEIELISKLLSTLSDDLFGISLDHIKAENIVNKNVNAIHDLFEIFITFIKYIPKQLSETNHEFRPKTVSKNDSKNNNNRNKKQRTFTKGVQTERHESKDFETKPKTGYILSKFDDYLVKCSSTSSSYSAPSTDTECGHSIDSTPEYSSNPCGDNGVRHPKQGVITRSKAIQTNNNSININTKTISPETLLPKAVSPKVVTFDDYKKAKTDNFATELGHRLHEALKLKEMSDVIEYKIKRYYKDVTVQTPVRSKKSSLKMKTIKKQSIRSKSSPIVGRTSITSKMKNNSKDTQFSSLNDLIKNFPEIPRNTIKTLRDQERHQNRIIENLNKDIVLNEIKVKNKLNSAVETQNKRSQIIKKDIKHLGCLANVKNIKAEKLKENASKRELRLEKARIHKTIESFHNDMVSKYKRLQSMEEKLVFREYETLRKQQQENIAQFRKRIKENNTLEIEKQNKMLEAFETLYRNKYEMLSEKLSKEELDLKNQISQQSQYLREVKNELNKKYEKDFKDLFLTNS